MIWRGFSMVGEEMTRRYYYHEHLADYAELKAKGLKSRGEIYGDSNDFDEFSSKPFLEATLPLLDVISDARVLELGCGTGPGACYLADKGFQVDGIDLIPDAIEKAKENAADLDLDVHFEVMDVCEIPLVGESYDLIVDSYCTQGIVLDEDRARMFRAIKRRLADRGYFLLTCCVLEPHRVHSDITIVDDVTGKRYLRFDKQDLFDAETETCYNLWRSREGLNDDKPENFDGTICVNGQWYIHQRRYRTHENLRLELKHYGFEVLMQGGEAMENAVCVHRDSGVTLDMR